MDNLAGITALVIAIGGIIKLIIVMNKSMQISADRTLATADKIVQAFEEQSRIDRADWHEREKYNREIIMMPLIKNVAENTKELSRIVKSSESIQGLMVNVFEEVNDLSKDVDKLNDNVGEINTSVDSIAAKLNQIDYKTKDHDHVLSELITKGAQ